MEGIILKEFGEDKNIGVVKFPKGLTKESWKDITDCLVDHFDADVEVGSIDWNIYEHRNKVYANLDVGEDYETTLILEKSWLTRI